MTDISDPLQNWLIGTVKAITPAGGRTWFVRCAGGSRLVLKVSTPPKGAKEVQLLDALQGRPIPVPLPLETRDGRRLVVDDNGQAWWLYPHLPGGPFQNHYGEKAPAQAAALGRAIGQLHQIFDTIPIPETIPDMSLGTQLSGWALPALEAGQTPGLEEIRSTVQTAMEALVQEANIQLIHRDAHPSNLLFHRGHLTGILDLELATRGFRSFDLCYCASSLLVDAIGFGEREARWPGLFRALIQSYQSCLPLPKIERERLFEMLLAVELLFLAYWLEQEKPAQFRETLSLTNWLMEHREKIPTLPEEPKNGTYQ
jgi:Ser/Thr protein kinase RdoA (MazF antagonist)